MSVDGSFRVLCACFSPVPRPLGSEESENAGVGACARPVRRPCGLGLVRFYFRRLIGRLFPPTRLAITGSVVLFLTPFRPNVSLLDRRRMSV